MNDFEAHEGSYDHQHRKVRRYHILQARRYRSRKSANVSAQRLKEMRQLTKDPNAAAKARAAEQKANEEAGLKSINISLSSSTTAPSGKKKPVFKSTLQPHNAAALGQTESKSANVEGGLMDENNDPSGAIRNGWYEERYQPQFVTGCDDDGCEMCRRGYIDLGPPDRDEVTKDF